MLRRQCILGSTHLEYLFNQTVNEKVYSFVCHNAKKKRVDIRRYLKNLHEIKIIKSVLISEYQKNQKNIITIK